MSHGLALVPKVGVEAQFTRRDLGTAGRADRQFELTEPSEIVRRVTIKT